MGVLRAVQVSLVAIAMRRFFVLVQQQVVQIRQQRDLGNQQRQQRSQPRAICRYTFQAGVYPYENMGVTEIRPTFAKLTIEWPDG